MNNEKQDKKMQNYTLLFRTDHGLFKEAVVSATDLNDLEKKAKDLERSEGMRLYAVLKYDEFRDATEFAKNIRNGKDLKSHKIRKIEMKVNFSRMENDLCIIQENIFLCKHDNKLHTGVITKDYIKEHIRSELGSDISFITYDEYKQRTKN